MSFDNTYPKRKDRRKPYRGSKAFDRTCRNHGACPYCERGRTVQTLRLKADVKLAMQDIACYGIYD